MQYFLQNANEKVWNAFEFGWNPFKILDRKCRPTSMIKPKMDWDKHDNEL